MPTSPFLDWNGNTFGITDEALWVNIRNTTSTAVPVTPTGDGVISAGNTTEVNLAGGATFEGTFENCLQYGAIRVAIYSSHASASRGLEFWCSKDGNNGFIDDSYTVPAATPKTYAVPVSALGVGDILSLCVIRDTTTNASVGAVLNWNEIR